jgi:hypothetical protein
LEDRKKYLATGHTLKSPTYIYTNCYWRVTLYANQFLWRGIIAIKGVILLEVILLEVFFTRNLFDKNDSFFTYTAEAV